MNAYQLVINELLNETSSSSEDESYWDVLLITLISNAVSGKRIVAKIVNFESTVVLW
jgi:fructose-1,6-bisphosphatase